MYLLVKSPVRDAHMRMWYIVRVLPAGNTLNMRMRYSVRVLPAGNTLKLYYYMYGDMWYLVWDFPTGNTLT